MQDREVEGMRKLLGSLILALVLVVGWAVPVMAAGTTQDVTVTATPLYLSITNSPSAWTLNGVNGGNSLISPNITYYAKGSTNDTTSPSATVLDTECLFTVTNGTGATTCDLTVTCGAFTGGGAACTNSNAGTNGSGIYGAHCWYSGLLYVNKVIVKDAGSDQMYSVGLAADTSLKWGAGILTRTNDWTSGTSSQATMTLIATAH